MSFSEAFSQITDKIGYAISTVVTALVTWYATSRTQNREDRVKADNGIRSDFDALVKANAAFREEIRKDLETAKAELEKAKKELEQAQERISTLEKELNDKQAQVNTLEGEVAKLRSALAAFDAKQTAAN